MNIDFKKGIINGLIIFAVTFLLVIVASLFGINLGSVTSNIPYYGWITYSITAIILAMRTEFKDVKDALNYSLLTVIVVYLLDSLIVQRSLLPQSGLWIAYAIITVSPVITLKVLQKK